MTGETEVTVPGIRHTGIWTETHFEFLGLKKLYLDAFVHFVALYSQSEQGREFKPLKMSSQRAVFTL